MAGGVPLSSLRRTGIIPFASPGGAETSRQRAGVDVGNTQALGLHRLAEGYFSPALGSLGQGGIYNRRGGPLGDGGRRTACVYGPVKSWSPWSDDLGLSLSVLV